MTLDERDLQRLYQSATAAGDRAGCPDLKTLMLPDVSEQVIDHIAACADCARAYRVAKSFVTPASSRLVRRPPAAVPWAIAAAAVIALIATLLLPHRQTDRPQIDIPIVDLESGATRGATEATAIEVPATSNTFVVIVHLPALSTPPKEAVLRDSSGRELWRMQWPPSRREVVVSFPRTLVKDGLYTISAGENDYRFSVRSR